MKKLLLFAVCISALLSSCSKDNSIVQNEQMPEGIYEFIYKGKAYSANFSKSSDGSVVWGDSEAGTLVKTLAELPGLATLVNSEGKYELFDSYEDMEKEMGLIKVEGEYNSEDTKAFTGNGCLYAYENINYQNFLFSHPFSTSGPRSLAQINEFNDRMTSFYLTVPSIYQSPQQVFIITMHEDIKYRGNSISFSLTDNVTGTQRIDVPNLASYPLYPGATQTWNKAISSIGISVIAY